jgi:hypothetical protein
LEPGVLENGRRVVDDGVDPGHLLQAAKLA